MHFLSIQHLHISPKSFVPSLSISIPFRRSFSFALAKRKPNKAEYFDCRHWNEWTFHGWMSVKWVSILNCLWKTIHISSFWSTFHTLHTLASYLAVLLCHCVCCSSVKCGNGSQMIASTHSATAKQRQTKSTVKNIVCARVCVRACVCARSIVFILYENETFKFQSKLGLFSIPFEFNNAATAAAPAATSFLLLLIDVTFFCFISFNKKHFFQASHNPAPKHCSDFW